jgi:hypothetical protein
MDPKFISLQASNSVPLVKSQTKKQKRRKLKKDKENLIFTISKLTSKSIMIKNRGVDITSKNAWCNIKLLQKVIKGTRKKLIQYLF